jgi:large subunit ribosomal protein L22
MQYKALYRYADSSPRKVRRFADLVRGRSADEALELLKYEHNKGARLMEQVIKSAVGNAEDRGARDASELLVAESRVDGGPILKRFQPRARGSAFPIKKRLCHIHVTLIDEEELA